MTYPVVPSPRDWSPGDPILTRYLRDDVTNAVRLIAGPPLVIAQQQSLAQGIPQNVITPVSLDVDITDPWAAHQPPAAQICGVLPGWYLAEGNVKLPGNSTTAVTIAGVRYSQLGMVSDVRGAVTSGDGNTSYPVQPGVADLIELGFGVQPVVIRGSISGSVFISDAGLPASGIPVVLAPAQTALPGGFAAGVTYWVINVDPVAGNFQLSSSPGGFAVTLTSSGSAEMTALDWVSLTAEQSSASTPAVARATMSLQWAGMLQGTVVPAPVAPAKWPAGLTRLTSPVTAGATSAVVADVTGMVTGGTLGLGTGTPAAENVIITGPPSGLTVPVSPAAYPHASGDTVAVPVSAAWLDQQVRDQIDFLSYPPMARLTSAGTSQSLPSQGFPSGTAVTWVQGSSFGGAAAWLDDWGGWSSGQPSRWTFPLGGVYYLYGQVAVQGSTSGYSLNAGLRISGGTTLWGDTIPGASGGGGSLCATVRRRLRVSAGQYAEVMGSQNLGSSLSLAGSGAAMCRLVAIWRGN